MPCHAQGLPAVAAEPTTQGRPRPCGFVLPVVLVALFVIEVLVAGAFVLGMYEHRSGLNMLVFQQARGVAEEGVVWRLTEWDSVSFAALLVGDSTSFSGSPRVGQGRYQGRVIRLGDRMFLIHARGFAQSSDISADYALLVRVDSSGPAALTHRAAVLPF